MIFKLFILKNFISPAAEVDRFYSNYEAQGWRRANGQKITDVIAVARGWEQADADKKRFPEPFIEALREIDEQFTVRGWDSLEMLRGIEKVDFTADSAVVYCSRQTVDALESSGASRVIIARINRDLHFRVKKAI